MKFKDLYIVPMIGIGYFDQIINANGSSWFIRTIMILCFKLEYYKKIKERLFKPKKKKKRKE